MLRNKVYRTIMTSVIVIISAFAMLSLSGCKEVKKNKDILTEYERAFFDTFVEKMLPKYHNPSSVEFVRVDASYMQDGLVQLTTSSKNEEEKKVEEDYILAVKNINATEYYTRGEYEELKDTTIYPENISRGDYCRIDPETEKFYIDAYEGLNKKGLIFHELQNTEGFLDKLKDKETFRIKELNSELEEYKKKTNLRSDILTSNERNFFDTFVTYILPKYYDPSSVQIINFNDSYMDAGLVRFATSSKNKEGKIVEDEFILTISGVAATNFYKEAGYKQLMNEAMYAQQFKKGDYCRLDLNPDNDQVYLDVDVDINKKGLIFYQMKNTEGFFDNLKDNYTIFRIKKLNSELEAYKQANELKKDPLTVYEKAFLNAFVENMLSKYHDPSSVEFTSIDASFLDTGIVRFTTSSKNEAGNIEEKSYFLALKNINAYDYYQEAEYFEFNDTEVYAPEITDGYYCEVSSLVRPTVPAKDLSEQEKTECRIRNVFYELNENSTKYFEKLISNYTLYRVDELNSALNASKK